MDARTDLLIAIACWLLAGGLAWVAWAGVW